MPPRVVIALISMFWLFTVSLFVYQEWLPWLRNHSQPPPFVVELADEVAPIHTSWVLLRKDKPIGSARTHMVFLKDNTFDLNNELLNLDITVGPAHIKIPKFTTHQKVTRTGELMLLDARAKMILSVAGTTIEVDSIVTGKVVGNTFVGESTFDGLLGKMIQQLEPIPLSSKNTFSALHPTHRFPPLTPGQTWRVTNLDPVNEALSAAVRQVVTKMMQAAFKGKSLPIPLPKTSGPKELLAEVQEETEVITHEDKKYTCWVIVYKADQVEARTWVDIQDGKVVRQEASGMGEKLILQRE